MALLLHLETATVNCSVALGLDGVLLDVLEQATQGYSHAENLHPFIDEILRRNDLEPSRLDGVVVSKGPGSYTGLRIGVSAAKGLAYALQIPLLSLRTTEVLANSPSVANSAASNDIIIAMIDARRMEVYSEIFDVNFSTIRSVHADILTSESFAGETSNRRRFLIGDGAAKAADLLGNDQTVIFDEYPSAQNMVSAGEKKYRDKDFEDLAYFEPYYFKEFVAGVPKKLI